MPIDKIEKLPQSMGDDGIRETLLKMRELIYNTDKNRIVKEKARQLIKDISPLDYEKQIEVIFRWVTNNVKYVRDIRGVEELTSPDIIIENIEKKQETHSSDCDDIAMLLSALLRAVGFKTRLEAIALHNNIAYDHARVSVLNPKTNKWIALEGTTKDKPIGFRFQSKREIIGLEV
ncbi:MAG: transglutaminase family protein [Candidatus Aenigmatarchaeota archaeon]